MTLDLIADINERKLALNVSKSFIVQAPAGSGKTTLLIQRYFSLLNQVDSPEEILAITFTKKAANEMRARVLAALKEAKDNANPPHANTQEIWHLAKRVLARDEQFNWHLLENPNQLRIQTIDSLCAYLTKQLPLLSNFGAVPDITENPILLYKEAVQEVLTSLESNTPWSFAIGKLLLHLDNDLNKLNDLLINLLAKRDQWLPYIAFDSTNKSIKSQLEQHLAAVVADKLKRLPALFPKETVAELITLLRFAAENIETARKHTAIFSCKNLTTLPDTSAEYLDAWLGIAALLTTGDGTWRKQFNYQLGFPAPSSAKNPAEKSLFNDYKQRSLKLTASLTDNEALRLALSQLTYLPKPSYTESQWEILTALLQVLKIAAAELRIVFQQHGQIDFIENTQAAIMALGNEEFPTDLALALDYQTKHILVDEFQDTSFTQYELLKKLTTGWEINDGRTLFIVGDPMQSIYRFREAEVGLFIRMQTHGLGHIKLHPLKLSVNFRSTKIIVDWINQHFATLFPPMNDIATGAITYHASSAQEKTASNPSSVLIKGFLDAEDDAQAKQIVAIINQQQKESPQDKIAILVRARQHLKDILPLLKKANIAYRAIEIDPLAERQTIQDLLALTSALYHPANRIAWLATLRAPWCGLTLADLLVIAGDNPYTTIYEQLEHQDILQKLSTDGQKRIARIFPILKAQIAERERQPTRLWVENTWLALGGPACLQNQIDLDDAKAFFDLLTEISHEPLNIHKLKISLEKLFAASENDDSILQVMTIHSAKGLEFDTVILPHLECKSAMDDHPLLLWAEYPLSNNQSALLLAPIHPTGNEKDAIYHFIYSQQQIKADYETERLFYVAATRAKKHLHLLFDTHKKDNGNYAIESGSFLQKLWPLIENNLDKIISTSEQPDKTSIIANKKSKAILRLQTDWQNPIGFSHQANIASHLKSSGFALTDTTPKIIGIVTHQILQYMANNGILWWKNIAPFAQTTYLKYHLQRFGISLKELPSSISAIQRILQNVLNDKRGQWILKAHAKAKSEFPLTITNNNKVESLIIDRTFIDETNTRWIIDYKTTILNQPDLDSFLAKEQKKYLEKMHQYANAMRLIESDTPIRLGLYFPALPAWVEW